MPFDFIFPAKKELEEGISVQHGSLLR